jgi:hypothetical protein
MPATSKSQQRFMALVKLYLEGKIKNPSESVRRAAKSMTLEDANDFASTKHEGLPEKKTAQCLVIPSVVAYLSYKKKKKQEKNRLNANGVSKDRLEKAAWQKTPVMIQNQETVYEFESLEAACQYLASIGTLSYEEVEDMLNDREHLINGFQVTYPTEKIADVIVVDPGRRRNAMLRAKRIRDMILRPDDHSKILDEYRKLNRLKEQAGEEILSDVADVSGDAIKTIAGLFKDE